MHLITSICTRCGFRNVEGARFCGNCGAQVSAVANSYPPLRTGAPPHLRRMGSARIFGFVLLLLIVVMAIVFFHNDYKTWTSGGSSLFDWVEFEKRWVAPFAKQAQPTQDNAPQTTQETDNEAMQSPKEAEKVKQVNLGADAMLATWRVTPLAFNEQENLRFDAVVVMPNDTVCLWVHDANPVPGVIYPTALFYYPRSKTLLSLSDVTFDLWMRECKKQEGVGVLPDIEANFNQIREKKYGLNQSSA